MKPVLLFDLDGVLVDSHVAVERAWSGWARSVGLDPADVMPRIQGRRTLDSVRALAPERDPYVEAGRMEEAEVADTEGLSPFPGARELLESLEPGRFNVVTSGTLLLASTRLRAVGLEPPPTIVTADDVERGKPDPQGYLLGAERLGADPAECVVVEDAPAGVAAGKAAGMTVWAVVTTHEEGELEAADARFASLAELGEAL